MIVYRRHFIRTAAVCALFALLFIPTTLNAQEHIDLDKLLHATLDKQKDSEDSKTRFTYRIHEHRIQYNDKGKKLREFTTLSELIYLSDLPYVHRLEVNGKPLAGPALEAEQKRYQDAIEQGKGLSDKQRTEQVGGKYKNVTFKLGRLLTDYDNQIKGHESIDGHNCVVVDATPKAALPDAPKRHAMLWIDPQQEELIKLSYDLLADEEDIEKGTNGWFRMKTIEGFSVDVETYFDFRLTVKNRKKEVARIVTETTMSDIHRFASTARIVTDETSEGK